MTSQSKHLRGRRTWGDVYWFYRRLLLTVQEARGLADWIKAATS